MCSQLSFRICVCETSSNQTLPIHFSEQFYIKLRLNFPVNSHLSSIALNPLRNPFLMLLGEASKNDYLLNTLAAKAVSMQIESK